jgi:hypothetical protein
MNVPYQFRAVKIPCAPDKEPPHVVLPSEKPDVLTPAGAWRLLKKRTPMSPRPRSKTSLSNCRKGNGFETGERGLVRKWWPRAVFVK